MALADILRITLANKNIFHTKVNLLKFSFIDFIIADVFLISVGKPSYSKHILKLI